MCGPGVGEHSVEMCVCVCGGLSAKHICVAGVKVWNTITVLTLHSQPLILQKDHALVPVDYHERKCGHRGPAVHSLLMLRQRKGGHLGG